MRSELNILGQEIRIAALKSFKTRGFGHVGGAMSVCELLAALYGKVMRIDPKRPGWEDRDWLVMSKGHAGPALYATLALSGYFPEEKLATLNQPGTNLPSHCDRLKTTGIDMTTGSLGQGVSTAIGVALGHRLDGKKSTVYLIVGDGECDEGQVWEGLMFSAHYKIDNLVLIIDKNKMQLDGDTEKIMDLGDLNAKLEAFGWKTRTVDGHDADAIADALLEARDEKNIPSAIILDTVKGKGCLLAEGVPNNHHIAFSSSDMDKAIEVAEQTLLKMKEVK